MQQAGFPSRDWRLSYRTSAAADQAVVDILHDFYLPALSSAVGSTPPTWSPTA